MNLFKRCIVIANWKQIKVTWRYIWMVEYKQGRLTEQWDHCVCVYCFINSKICLPFVQLHSHEIGETITALKHLLMRQSTILFFNRKRKTKKEKRDGTTTYVAGTQKNVRISSLCTLTLWKINTQPSPSPESANKTSADAVPCQAYF